MGLTPEEMAEELGGDTPAYPRVKIPSGGAPVFEVPGDDPESPDAVKELTGVVVHHHRTNAYWLDSDLSDSPPDCSSMDGVTGHGNPGGDCRTCPFNQFESGEGGRGKACKNMERLYILRPGDGLPLSLSLPPTSLQAWRTYKTLCVSRGRRVCGSMTRITLSRKQNKSGQPYAQAVFRLGDPLSQELARAAYEYRQGVKGMVEAMALEGRDPAPEGGEFREVADNGIFGVDPRTGEVTQ